MEGDFNRDRGFYGRFKVPPDGERRAVVITLHTVLVGS